MPNWWRRAGSTQGWRRCSSTGRTGWRRGKRFPFRGILLKATAGLWTERGKPRLRHKADCNPLWSATAVPAARAAKPNRRMGS
ncbi:hypothetical protein DM194_08850 [Azospirillum ramasamyi]|uniref:Uncharacterized protein n=1 Tax=Azospirillum ramasamyi TaxID=682998 RepID=A0A2U9S441_9PROT|nr:hypothetical protein DM194_08850 [Azospirillum ramasamyi]